MYSVMNKAGVTSQRSTVFAKVVRENFPVRPLNPTLKKNTPQSNSCVYSVLFMLEFLNDRGFVWIKV